MMFYYTYIQHIKGVMYYAPALEPNKKYFRIGCASEQKVQDFVPEGVKWSCYESHGPRRTSNDKLVLLSTANVD